MLQIVWNVTECSGWLRARQCTAKWATLGRSCCAWPIWPSLCYPARPFIFTACRMAPAVRCYAASDFSRCKFCFKLWRESVIRPAHFLNFEMILILMGFFRSRTRANLPVPQCMVIKMIILRHGVSQWFVDCKFVLFFMMNIQI